MFRLLKGVPLLFTKRQSILSWGGLFSILLCYFIIGNGWYESSTLIIHGRTLAENALVIVQWDSGEGFNEYERREFHPAILPVDNVFKNTIIFGGTGQKNGASLSKEVVCTAIIVDGRKIDLSLVTGDGELVNGELYFNDNQSGSLSVNAKFQVSLQFRTNNHSGFAFISMNGVAEQHDLYMANEAAKYRAFDHWLILPDGSFTLSMPLPRYAIHDLEIINGTSGSSQLELLEARVHSKGDDKDLLNGRVRQVAGSVHFYSIFNGMKKYFQQGQFYQQIVFSLLTTWLLFAVVSIYTGIGGIRACFVEEDRKVFWFFFSSALLIFGLWLAAFWPGVMSVDSLKVWRAAMLPDVYLNDHPVLNVFLYKYLFQLWSNPAVVPLAQVFLMALLVSWFFFWLYRQGLSLKLLLPCFLLILCSIPIDIYNTILWKDIPFALLVMFWAGMLVQLYHERCRGRLRWSGQRMVALLLLGLSLVLIRHNGLVFLVILPVMLIVLRLVPLKKACGVVLVCALLVGISYTVVQRTGKIPGAEFITREIQRYAGGLSIANIAEDLERMTRDYIKIFDFEATDQKWDKVHYYFKDRYAYWFLLHSGWWDLYPYKKEIVHFPALRQVAMQVYEKSYQQPWVWFSWNPVWLLGLLPVLTLLFWWFPRTAIVGAVLLGGALPLVYLRIFNWRYYYFLYLGLLFMLPLIPLDLYRKKLDGTT